MAGFTAGTYTWNDTKAKWFATGSTTVSVASTTTTLVHRNIKLDGTSATANLHITATSGRTTLLGGSGDDKFSFTAATGAMWVNGGTGSDAVTIDTAGVTVESTGTFGTDTITLTADTSTTFNLKSFKFSDLDFASFTSASGATYTGNVVVGSSGGLVIKNSAANVVTSGDLLFQTSDKTFNTVFAASTAAGTTLTGGAANATNPKDYMRQYGNFDTTFLKGGEGDTLIGAGGNDTYYFGSDNVTSTSKIAAFNGGEGIDVLAVTTLAAAAAPSYTLDLDNSKFTSVEVVDASASTVAQVIRGLASATQGDTLIGGTGADSIWSKAGNDSIKGGIGADTFWFAAGDGTDTINDFKAADTDTIRLSGVSMSGISYNWDTTNSGLLVSYNSASAADSVFLAGAAYAAAGAKIATTSDNKTFGLQAVYNSYNGIDTAPGLGSTGADYIRNFYTGTADSSTVNYDGNGGADTIIGGSGNDSVKFDKALAYVDGGEGKDTLTAGTATTSVTIDLYNNAAKYLNFEAVVGGSAADVLRGYASASETLIGGDGADQLWSAGGNDYMVGGDKADTYWFAAGDGADTVNFTTAQASDKDVFKFTGLSQGAITSITKNADSDNSLVFGYTSGASVTIDDFSNATYMTNASFQFSDVTFHMITDQAGANLAGSTSADVMIALGDGDRTFTGNGGKDSVFGGAGNDTIIYKSDLAYVSGGAGTDGLEVGSAIYTPATINLSDSKFVSIEKVTGGSGADVLRGAAAAETLNGGAGADALWGAAGNDYLQGGAGADTYWFTAGDGIDTIANETDNTADTVKFYAVANNTDVAAAIVDGSLNITLTDGSKLVLDSWESSTTKVNKFTFDNGTYSLSSDAKTWTKI